MDVVLLSRLQFTITIMFHYLFPPLTIGLGLVMVIMEGMYLKTKNIEYEQMTKFWTKIFAVNFAMGVASGIVMEFQFGTNWATYSRFVGDVFGSALAAEGIFAFFLESGFLAVLIFGWDRVSAGMHFFATLMVFLGSCFSAVWIVVANSWQQTPTGFHVVGDALRSRAEIVDFWAMVFNPSSVVRLTHVLVGAFVLGSFFVLSISSYYLLKKQHISFAKKSFSIALWVAFISSLLMPVIGHKHAKVVAEYQPAKLAAFEGLYKTPEAGAALSVFGIPDSKEQKMKYHIEIPGLLSFLVHGDFTTPVIGLDQFPEEDRPPVFIPYVTYHMMIACGIFFILITTVAVVLWSMGKVFEHTLLLKIFVVSVIGPYIANMAGWTAAEVGRQPWVVYGLLRTADGVSKSVSAEEVLFSIIMFSLIYALLFALWIFVSNNKIQAGPVMGKDDSIAPEGFMQVAIESSNKHLTELEDPKEDK